jgi:CubicO group peptidase (beta-lactamase class C family)
VNALSTSRRRRPRAASIARRVTVAATSVALVVAAAGCGGDDSTGDATAATAATTTESPSTTVAVSDPPDTTDPPESPPTTVDDSPSGLSDNELAARIEAVLTDALAPGSISWTAYGADVPATAAVAAVRIPGRDDVLVAAGENVDGTPVEADAPFLAAHLTTSLVGTVAFQLIDEGVLDPARTVDEWVPTLPNADRVTVRMLIDEETGWSDHGLGDDPVVADFARVWTLREAVELQATAMTALAEPGTSTDDGYTNHLVLALVVEEVGGQPLADQVRERVTGPAGLDDTRLLGGSEYPPGYRHGVFPFNGTPVVTSAFDPTSWLTFTATHSAVSTPSDLLDLLDVWAAGSLFTTDRTPAPERYAPEPVLDDDGNPFYVAGREVPFNGFCPCAEVDGGFEPVAFGRAPAAIGAVTLLLHYPDGVSVIVNMNSRDADFAAFYAVANAVHDIAAEANGS